MFGRVAKKEILTAPPRASLALVRHAGRTAARPFDSRGLGRRLAQDHEKNQVATSLQEMSARREDQEVLFISGRQVLAMMAYGLRHRERANTIPPDERISLVSGIMGEFFPDRRFDDFSLDDQDVATLRQHVPSH